MSDSHSWFKVFRSQEAKDLLALNKNAFLLGCVIAMRAKWTAGKNILGLIQGEAMIGDHDSYGMTEREYRTAKRLLEKFNFATFVGTTKGTIAKLTDSRLFSITNDSERRTEGHTPDEQATDMRRLTIKIEGIEGKKNTLGELPFSQSEIDSAEKIYSEYPKKAGKADALRAIRKEIKAGASPDTLLEKTIAYAKAVAGNDPQFIPYPAKWFGHQRYKDDPSTWANAPREVNRNAINRNIGTTNEGHENDYANLGTLNDPRRT